MKNFKVLFVVFFIAGCATYQSKVRQARNHLADGESQAAVKILETHANQEGKDQVLYMLDYGLALHEAGDLKKSNETLIAVDRLADVKDYVSLSRQAGSLFLSEALVQYKSERFENLLINAYLALNFTLQNNFESALVECRRIDEKLNKFRLEKEHKGKNYYARYLSAMIWEAEKNWDSAYIDYKNAYNIDSSPSYLREDLIRSAWRARRYTDLKKWQRQFPEVKLAEVKKQARNNGELVFVYQQGWIPRKYPRPENFRFPHLVRQPAGFRKAIVEVDGKKQEPTEMLYRVGDEAIRTLNADYDYLVAKKLLGIIAKEVAADQIRQKNETLGALAAIAMHAADQADLRQWSTLPNSFQLSKVSLKPGKHKVVLYATGPAGESKIWDGEVEIKKGKKTFITKRSFY